MFKIRYFTINITSISSSMILVRDKTEGGGVGHPSSKSKPRSGDPGLAGIVEGRSRDRAECYSKCVCVGSGPVRFRRIGSAFAQGAAPGERHRKEGSAHERFDHCR